MDSIRPIRFRRPRLSRAKFTRSMPSACGTPNGRAWSSTTFLNDVLKRDLYNIRAANVEMKTLPPQERVRRLLAEIARGQGAQPSNGLVEFALPLNNSEMAEWLGISGTQYKRTRSALKESGQLLQKAGRRVAIRERE
jgi:CRP-like cAMP-binding protein